MYRICRTCFEIIKEDEKSYNLDAEVDSVSKDIVSQLESCVPQLTLSIAKNPVMCSNCVKSLEAAYKFKLKCLQTEERIYNYILGVESSNTSVDVGSVLNYEIQQNFDSINAKIDNESKEPDRCNFTSTDANFEQEFIKEINEIEKHDLEDIDWNLFNNAVSVSQEFFKDVEDVKNENLITILPLDSTSKEIKQGRGLEKSCQTEVHCGKLLDKLGIGDSDNQMVPPFTISHNNEESSKHTLHISKKRSKKIKVLNTYSEVIDESVLMPCTSILPPKMSELTFKSKYLLRNRSSNSNFNEKQIILRSKTTTNVKTRNKEKSIKISVSNSNFNKEKIKSKTTTNVKKRNKDQIITVYQCKKCDYSTLIKRKLNLHEGIHIEGKHFRCDKCNYVSLWKRCLRGHIEAHHSYKKPLECIHCNFKTPLRCYLNIHLGKHSESKILHCKKCNFQTNIKHSLKQHELKHTREKPYVCKFCDFRSAYKFILKKHIINEHSKK